MNYESGARTRFAALLSGFYTMVIAVLVAASAGWGVPLIDGGTVSDAAIAADLLESAEPRAVSGGVARLNTLARAAHAGRADGVARTGRASA